LIPTQGSSLRWYEQRRERSEKQQVIALGRLEWPLRRIEEETGVRRETAGAYLKAAGIEVRPPGAWGRRPPAKPANENGVTTGSDASKPANTVNPNPNPENLSTKGKAKARTAKPANENAVTTGFGVELSDSEQESTHPVPSTTLCEPFRDAIELGLSQGRDAMAIWQGPGVRERIPWRLSTRKTLRAQALRKPPPAAASRDHYRTR
jgi:hypothetical protein